MTGRAWAYDDAPDEIAQYFVSELYPGAFSAALEQAVTNVKRHAKPITKYR